jgi:hypothetical protein
MLLKEERKRTRMPIDSVAAFSPVEASVGLLIIACLQARQMQSDGPGPVNKVTKDAAAQQQRPVPGLLACSSGLEEMNCC